MLTKVKSFKIKVLTVSSISLVWAADTQKRARDSMMGVAGKPTTTVPMFLLNISRPKALQGATVRRTVSEYELTNNDSGDCDGGARTRSWPACRASGALRASRHCRR